MDADLDAQHDGHSGAAALPPQTRARASSRRGPAALFGLIALLLCVIAAALGVTTYLLRDSPRPAASPAPAAVRPFSILYLRQGAVWSWNAGVTRRLIALPAGGEAGVTRLLPAPNAGMALIVGSARVWLLTPHARAVAVTLPHVGADPWSVVDAAWTGHRSFALLLEAAGARVAREVIAHYTAGGGQPAVQTVGHHAGRLLSLSPDATQVAVLDTLAGHDAFATQYVLELRDVETSHRSAAYRYMGGRPIDAVAWSPDRGTVALHLPDGGLAIQKSSGRPVLHVDTGVFPVAFSHAAQARLAYVARDSGRLRLHILILHGERDTPIELPVQRAPRALAWTPDARAVLYTDGAALWQVSVETGSAVRLVSGAALDQAIAAPPSAPLTR